MRCMVLAITKSGLNKLKESLLSVNGTTSLRDDPLELLIDGESHKAEKYRNWVLIEWKSWSFEYEWKSYRILREKLLELSPRSYRIVGTNYKGHKVLELGGTCSPFKLGAFPTGQHIISSIHPGDKDASRRVHQ